MSGVESDWSEGQLLRNTNHLDRMMVLKILRYDYSLLLDVLEPRVYRCSLSSFLDFREAHSTSVRRIIVRVHLYVILQVLNILSRRLRQIVSLV